MRKREKDRKGSYRGELRSRFNTIEQWDGKRWREPPEVGWTNETIHGNGPLHFDVDAPGGPYAGDEDRR